MDKLIKLKENPQGWNVLHIETSYDLGNYSGCPRGYYLHVTPEKRDGGLITVTAFSGVFFLLKEVSRKSKKAELDAEQMAEEKETYLVNLVLNKHGLELEV